MAIGVMNGNWKQQWKLEPMSAPLSLLETLSTSLEVAEGMTRQIGFPNIVESGKKKTADVTEQIRLMATITEEGENLYYLFGFDQAETQTA